MYLSKYFLDYSVDSLALHGFHRILEQELIAGERNIDSNDKAALFQLLSQAEKDSYLIDKNVASNSEKDRLSVLECRLMAGPLKSSHLGVLQLLGQAEVGLVL